MPAKKKPGRKGPNAPRRAKGTGTTFFDERKQRWVGRKVVGKTPGGKTLYVQRERRTLADLVAALDQAGPPGPDTTVAEWGDRWLAGCVKRPRTMAIRRNAVEKHVKPRLGAVRVRDLDARRVEEAAAHWAVALPSPNSVRQVLAVLHTCLGEAVVAGLIPANPMAAARRPPGKKKKIDPFPPADLARIVAEGSARPAGHPIALLAATGCRAGEALALDCGEFDPAAGTVSIARTQPLGRGEAAGPPKTATGVRTIRVPAAAVPALVAARGGRAAGPLFASGKDRRRSYGLLRGQWVKVCKRLGLRFRNLHQLRHSVATAMISAGVPLGDVAAYLGDTVETVVRTYLHATGVDPSRAMDRLFGGGTVDREAGGAAGAKES